MRGFVKKRFLLVTLAAVLAPLVLLLVLQYRWLTTLEETSAIAKKAWLSNYLEAVSTEIEYFYRTQAERALNVPPYYLLHNQSDKIGSYLSRIRPEGVKYLFSIRYVDQSRWGEMTGYDTIAGELRPPRDRMMLRAITVALSPWKIIALKGGAVPSHDVTVEQMDPSNVVIANPITDNACRLLGVAGMIIDTDYFEETVLPAAIQKSLPKFFDERDQANLDIRVLDSLDHVIWGEDSEVDTAGYVQRDLSFVFSNWRMLLGSRSATPEEWAKSNFFLNMSLSVLVALVLLAAIVIALRVASREVRLSQMKSDFVSNVSHELRTPLASVRVFGEFLRLGRVKDEGKIREYGEYIETESRRLTQLINNILDFSMIESGAKIYQLEPTDLRKLVRDTLRTLEVGLRHKGIDLTLEDSAEDLPEIELDADAIGQALSNLVDNAVKYSNGANRVRIGLVREKDEVVISVTDFGVGISPDEQKKIFERFHRAGSSLVHDVKGSGLGLSIVSHIVQAHGGRVGVNSQPGQGSTFSIHLPVANMKAADPRRIERGSATPAEPMGQT